MADVTKSSESDPEDRPAADQTKGDAGIEAIAEAEIVKEPAERPPEKAEPAAAPQVIHTVQKASPVPLVIGGVVAAVIGFVLAQAVPNGWPVGGDPTAITALRADLDAERARADGLAADVARLSGALAELPKPDAALPDQIAALQASLADLQGADDVKLSALANSAAELDGRVAVLERRPVTGGAASDTALSAYEAEIKALRDMVEAQSRQSATAGADIAAIAATAKAEVQAAEERAAALQTQAESTARLAMARSAVQRIKAAIETGGGYATALEDLAAAGVTVPADLQAQSTGVATLQSLRFAFADPARAALGASLKATVGDGAMARLGSFLRNQVGARSLTAQEGADPDAVLSRAEAALGTGDLQGAVAEVASLPAEGQAPFAAWTAEVAARMSALASVEALAKTIEN